MNKPNYYDGSGPLQPEVIAAVSDKKQTETKQFNVPKITDLENKPSYYDGSGVISFK